MIAWVRRLVLRIALRILRDDVRDIEQTIESVPMVVNQLYAERKYKVGRIAALERQLAAKAIGGRLTA